MLARLHAKLLEEGAVPRFVGVKLGQVKSEKGDPLDVEVTMETAPAVLWDALVLPDGRAAAEALMRSGHVIEFIKDQYRHCKPILVVGSSRSLVEWANLPAKLRSGKPDPGLLLAGKEDSSESIAAFIQAIASHRSFERETDPPIV
jgi:catalase